MKKSILFIFGLLANSLLFAQTNGVQRGAQALTTLTNDLEAYLDPVTTVIYVVAAITAIIGAFRVFSNWQQGKDNVMSGAMGWFGAMLFLLIANAVVRAMFIN
ncbi:uncharacterized protein DUF4134 [Dyadobacter jejuensis]|uniref:Uncharacterized protein DUF4134 n=1 Tax=Dyadobacter jejuensis TaxID=1082580 RepID=A0A316A7J2_9BACT|nr:DUF4134 family protein [Dyadobacter jejuensis]PWJ53419.1 uncharacterized protein DUF4134 [Dyadobacter jejuensis]